MLMLGVGLVACQPTVGAGGGVPKAGGSVRVASWQEQDSLLACNITASASHACAYVNPSMEGLLTAAPSSEVPSDPSQADYWKPELAVEVPTLENGDVNVRGNKMTVTWKLRANVFWHDGVAFTAKDVKATYDFWWLRYRRNNPTPLISTTGWDQVEAVDTPDRLTAVVHFRSIYAPYMTLGSGPYGILPDHLLEQVWARSGDLTREKVNIKIPGGFSGTETLDHAMVGTGPFMFKEWIAGDHLTLVRNPRWWGHPGPYLDRIKVKFEPDVNSEINDLRDDAVDLALDLRPSLLPPISRMSDVTTAVILASSAEHLDFNLHDPLLQAPVLRRAILMSIDRKRIIDTMLLGKTTIPPDAWMCTGTGTWCLDPSARQTPYDQAGARRLLDDAGYKLRTDGPCRGYRTDPQGRCVQLHITTTSLPLREEQESMIAADLARVGIQLIKPLLIVPQSKMFGACNAGGIIYSHDFDIAMYTNNYGAPAEPDTMAYPTYHSSQIPADSNGCRGQNTTYVSDPLLDAALDRGRQTVEAAARRNAYISAQRRLAAILPDIPLYQGMEVEAYHGRLHGYQGNEFWWMNNTSSWWVSS